MSRRQSVALKLFVVGFLSVIAGGVLLAVSSFFSESNASSSIIILIGPIPIIIGSGPDALAAIILAGILSVISLMLFVLVRHQAG